MADPLPPAFLPSTRPGRPARPALALALALALAGACAGGDADVAGNYTAALTNRTDGCSIGWVVGESATVETTATQRGSEVTLSVEGIVATALLTVLVGSATFEGEVRGDRVDVAITGTVPRSSGNCAYTTNAAIGATLDGDTLRGRIEYRAATNGGTDCGARTGCTSVQDFNATRPPR
jgi:hypothetical protein